MRRTGENKTKTMGCVEAIVERGNYAEKGIHKGMQGVVWEKGPKDDCWIVLFPQCGDKEDIANLYMEEEDPELIPVMSPDVNEQIRAQFEKEVDQTKSFAERLDDLSNYRV